MTDNNKPSRVTDTESFIKKAVQIHGGKYDYSKAAYIGTHKDVSLVCDIHGDFQQTPRNHLKGHGCAKCGSDRYFNGDYREKQCEGFFKNIFIRHGDRFDYSNFKYVGMNTLSTIICREHGEFEQTPYNHLNSVTGCPVCCSEAVSKKFSSDTQTFIESAKSIHNGKYTYENVDYTLAHEKVIITCKEHGNFEQTPNSHLNGNGCPNCWSSRRSSSWSQSSASGLKGLYGTDIDSNLYLLRIDEEFLKIGVSVNMPSRLRSIKREYGGCVEVLATAKGSANILWECEQEILRDDNLVRFKPDRWFRGGSECFHLDEEDNLIKQIKSVGEWVSV